MRAPRRMYPLRRRFLEEIRFPVFLHLQTGIHGSVVLTRAWRREGNRLVAGGRQESGKLLATGASLVARNSTRAFLEFPAAPGYAGDTNFARTFPWKRPPPSPWVGWHTGEKGTGEGDVAEATDGGFLKGRRARERELPLNLRWAIQFPSCPKVIRNIALSAERDVTSSC
ncbi:unnamed protein product [Lasius platythorax]